MKYRKRTAAAAIIVLSLLAAGCGSASNDEHAQHASDNQEAANEHSGHPASENGNAGGDSDADSHSGHGSDGDSDASEKPPADLSQEWRFSPQNPRPGEETNIELFLYDNAGKPIEKYEVNHEKLMHLIIVSEDMAEFMHIHPEYVGEGKFEASASFAKSGAYKLFADFIPTGSAQTTITSTLKVAGTKETAEPLEKDAELTKSVDGITAALKVSSFKAGEEADLTFTFNDAATKKPITDLQPYLGAIGHVVILNKDLTRYLHVHPKDGNGSGPTADFSTSFPEPGLYKIWGQFQRDGETFIIPFTIEAE